MICQVLNCKRKANKDHVGTLCKKHGKIYEKIAPMSIYEDPFKYKTINEKGKVWTGGYECVRAIPTSTVNEWIKIETKKIDALRETIKIIQSQIENHTDKLNDHKKTKNMRYHR